MTETNKKGPAKITKDEAKFFRPHMSEIFACHQREGKQVCGLVEKRSLDTLPKNSANQLRPTIFDAEGSRQKICLIRRACPVSDHMSQGERIGLPCSVVLYEIEDFLGVERGGDAT